MRFWRRRRALVCRQAVELMADYLDGRLPPKELARLKEHLAACPHCSEYLAQLRMTIDALGRAEPDALTDDALDELVGLYRRWQAQRRSSTLHARLGRPRRRPRRGAQAFAAIYFAEMWDVRGIDAAR